MLSALMQSDDSDCCLQKNSLAPFPVEMSNIECKFNAIYAEAVQARILADSVRERRETLRHDPHSK
jgi:hypothetical protein